MSDPTDTPRSEDPPADPTAEPGDPSPGTGSRSGLLGGRLMVAAGAVAVGIVAAVIIVSVTNDPEEESADASSAVDIAADSAEADAGTTSADPGDAPANWEVSTTGSFEVALEPAEAGLASVTVTDPATPSNPDTGAQHCVLVTLEGPTTVEAYGCSQAGGDETVEVPLSAPGDPLVGCAAVLTRDAPGELTALDATSNFLVPDDSGLPAGTYDMTVVAVSGAGDGCAPAEDDTEHEATARTVIQVT